jgi:YidC/Oxa1 family membrane protein insertase
MKVLKPYTVDIKAKFKDNEEAQNRAIGKLYEDAQQNPLAGCATSLAQLPILLGLYRGISLLAQEGELEQPFLWIPSLQGPVSPPDYRGIDWLTSGWTAATDGGLPTPGLGWETTLAFLIMPVILVILQSATMSVLQPDMDENMGEEEKKTLEDSQKFIKFLPLLIGFFSIQVPAGLTIYWFTSNLFTLSQSLAVKAYYKANPPEIKLPEYWDTALDKDKDFDSMTPAERRQAVQAGMRIGPTMIEMIDDARFHLYVQRKSFRSETKAWDRVVESKTVVPLEFEAWVAAAAMMNEIERTTPTAKESEGVSLDA